MNQLSKLALASTFTLLMSTKALALFEVRGHLGANLGEAESSNITIAGEDFPAVPAALSFAGDALFYLPMVPLGIGARYENFFVGNEGDVEFDLQITRISAVVNYRLIDTGLYLGPIATLGLSHSNTLEISDISGQSDRTYEGTMDAFSTYSIGLEAGLSLLGLMVGAEAGYMAMNMENPETSSGEELGSDIDFTGMYAKLVVGFGF